MSEVALALVSLVLGVIGSAWVSKYYFQRSVDKALTPYIQYASSLFVGVDPTLREHLKIAFKGTPIADLTEIQLLIANTGERSIRDLIKPLTLHLPGGCSILEASVLHVDPDGREVHVSHDGATAVYTFPLLNSYEFFITKLLIHGRAKSEDIKFSVVADDLPPFLKLQHFHFGLLDEPTRRRRFDWSALGVGLLVFLAGAGIAGLVYTTVPVWQSAYQSGFAVALRSQWFPMLCSIVGGLAALFLLVVGATVTSEFFGRFRLRLGKRRGFRIPNDLKRFRSTTINIVD